jgi:hypothetical protein
MAMDMTAYERMRAENHEETCRVTASLVHIPHKVCRFRQCRRRGICSGPMVPSRHQAGQEDVQRMLGVSGRACEKASSLSAHLDPELYALFKQAMNDLERHLGGEPASLRWRVVCGLLSRRRQRPLTSAADRPTSATNAGDDSP